MQKARSKKFKGNNMIIEKAIVNYESYGGEIVQQYAKRVIVEKKKEWLILVVEGSTIFVPRDRVFNIIRDDERDAEKEKTNI